MFSWTPTEAQGPGSYPFTVRVSDGVTNTDPNFEEHLSEGPYVVFDDSAKMKYRNDPRVHFVPGHPVLRNAMPELMKGLGVKFPGSAIMKWQQFQDRTMHALKYGTPRTKARAVGKPLALGALAGGVVAALIFAGSKSKKIKNGQFRLLASRYH